MGNAKAEKRMQKLSVFASVNPDSNFDVETMIDGLDGDDDAVDSFNVTQEDILNVSGVIGLIGQYILAIGSPDTTGNADVVKTQLYQTVFGTQSIRII